MPQSPSANLTTKELESINHPFQRKVHKTCSYTCTEEDVQLDQPALNSAAIVEYYKTTGWSFAGNQKFL